MAHPRIFGKANPASTLAMVVLQAEIFLHYPGLHLNGRRLSWILWPLGTFIELCVAFQMLPTCRSFDIMAVRTAHLLAPDQSETTAMNN